jgi:hypothetical protein
VWICSALEKPADRIPVDRRAVSISSNRGAQGQNSAGDESAETSYRRTEKDARKIKIILADFGTRKSEYSDWAESNHAARQSN